MRDALGRDIDYAMLIKLYGESADKEGRYSAPTCIGRRTEEIIGFPKAEHISTCTSSARTFRCAWACAASRGSRTAFSKKIENHQHAIAIYFMHYDFVRVHQTLRCTPAMAAGVVETH